MSEEINQGSDAPAPVTDMESMIDNLLAPQESPETEEAPESQAPEVSTKETTATSEPDEDDEAEAPDDSGEVEDDGEESDDEEADDGESEDTETEDEEDEDEDSEEEQPESEVVFEVDGESITLDDLKAGYLRQSDYTTKTQEVAADRAKVEERAEQLKAYEDTLAQNLALSLQVLEPQLAELMDTDWNALLQADAFEYQQKQGELQQAQWRYAQLQEAAQQQVAQRQQQAQEAFELKRTAERKELLLSLPDLADKKKGRDLAHSIKEYAINQVGLSEQEAAGMVDHRLILVLNKARQFDELQSAGLSVADKKIKAGPKKTIKSGKPQSKGNKASRSQRAARERLETEKSAAALVDLLAGGG
jgi:mannose/fructose/N-acetylgalactosamine-specific phosphotransferase system component IIB